MFDMESSARSYAAALEAFGLDVSASEAESAAAIRNERPAIRLALILSLDDWARYSSNGTKNLRLHRIANQADGDDWRRRYRAASDEGDLAKLKNLADEARQLELPVASAHLLAVALKDRGARAEAAALLRQARRQHPEDFWVYYDLGACLLDPNHHDPAAQDEAEGSFWAALALRPGSAVAQNSLGIILHGKGDLDGAAACFRKAIQLDPRYAYAHSCLGIVLGEKGDLDGAAACFRKAIQLDPKFAAAHGNLGVALQDQGKLDEAIAEFREAVRLDPHFALASANLAKAEQMAALQDKLPALQKGEFKPRTSDELHAMAGLCKIKKLFLASARMYADAFADDPKLADDLKAAHRYDAACHAALAAAGQGEDAAKLDDKEKARLRKQALDWLRADLALRSKQLQSGQPADLAAAQVALQRWQQDKDLAGLRDKEALAKLPADEQEACRKLWADVQALLDKADQKK
jgi:Flp pilus assembly protein TadD